MSQPALVLTTPRLRLREISFDDWPAVLAYQQKPEYLQYYPWDFREKEDVQRFVQMFVDWRHEEPRAKYQFAITLPHNGQLIGLCGARKKTAFTAEAEIGYELDPAFWGRGYATEAARHVLDFTFSRLTVHRVWATCVAGNGASARVLEKIGLQQEGRLRENRWMKGRWWDTLVYAILLREWRAVNDKSETGN
ncbi:MAG: GNAT family protein [Anaerolineae bacterium]